MAMQAGASSGLDWDYRNVPYRSSMAGNGDDRSRYVIHSGAIPVCRISSMAPELPGIYRDRSGSHYADGLFATASDRSAEHTSELQSLMRISYPVFCLTNKTTH